MAYMKSSAAMMSALLAVSCGDGGSSAPSAAPSITAPSPAPTSSPPPNPSSSPYPAGLSSASMSSGGIERTFSIYAPTANPRGILLILHGGGGSEENAARGTALAAFQTIADRERLLAVYPSGANGNWNDCRPAGGTEDSTADDVVFLDALIARLEREYSLGVAPLMVAGHSNGGMMAMRYAFERPARLTFVAIASANLPATPEPGLCSSGPGRAVPILFTHGDRDTFAVYAEGCPARGQDGNCPAGGVISAEATRDRWLAINGLAAVAPVVTRVDNNPNDGSVAVRHRYAGASPVDWWRLEGAGHPPPSLAFSSSNPLAGPQNRDIEFAEAAWAFGGALFK